VEDVEREIEKAEARVKTVEEALSQAAFNADAAQLTQLATEYEQARMYVDELLVEWERLAETVSE
jgi:ATP-binding cassette subfamily F protein 3